MILGTFANFDALDRIDEHPPSHIIVEPIDMQPKIVLPKPVTEKMIEPERPIENFEKIESKIDVIEPIKMLVDEPIQSNELNKKTNKANLSKDQQKKLNLTRRKPLKPLRVDPSVTSNVSNQPVVPIREINIENKLNDAPVEEKVQEKLPEVGQKSVEIPKEPLNISESPKEKADIVLNKEAIQKEEQEIAIEAKENKDKNQEEILREVKNVIEKQNNETKKMIQEIDKKMDKIEKMQEAELKRDSLKDGDEDIKAKEQVKKMIDSVPIIKLLNDQKVNLTQKEEKQSSNNVSEKTVANDNAKVKADDDIKSNLK